MTEIADEVKDLLMQYPDSNGCPRTVLDHVSLQIEKGEFLSLLGPSGCGKTTLLKLIADLQKPVSGTIRVDGLSPREARLTHKYGMVFQSPSLMEWRTVLENIELPLEILGVSKKERRKRAEKQLEIVDLKGYENSLPGELSGGMQQRVGIARALSMEPDILLMDEPFSALDQFTKERLHGDLLRIWENTGKTILFVTHNISEAVYLSDRICVFSSNPARLVDVIRVPLPRPREPVLLKTDAYYDAIASVREIFEENYYENI